MTSLDLAAKKLFSQGDGVDRGVRGPSSNDFCADAFVITDGVTPFDTLGATTDGDAFPGHPECDFAGDNQVNQDVWFDYVGSCNGILTVSTCNDAGYDTRVAIYEGFDCPATANIACNDDATGCAGFTSIAVAGVVQGWPYKIRVGGYGTATGSGNLTITCAGCSVIESEPPNCAIDARQPHHFNSPAIRYGWDWVDVTFDCPIPSLDPFAFLVEQVPPAGPFPPPFVVAVIPVGPTTARLQLSGPINPGHWTCLLLLSPTGPVPIPLGCLGYLPADADASGISDPSDIIAVIDYLNGVNPRPFYGVDMDRSGIVDPSDIIGVIDLLNGAGTFMPWMAQGLPPCPTD